MALTKVGKEGITGIDNSSDATAITIDSSERVMIGTTTEGQVSADDLTVATSANTGITIRSGTASNGAIYFSDGTSGDDEYRGILDYDHNDNKFRIYTDAVERMRIDSTGAVTIPNQPAFYAETGSTQTDFGQSSTHTLAFSVERFDQNSDFASNNLTAPVTGRYFLHTTLRFESIDTAATYYLWGFGTSNHDYFSIIDPKFSADVGYISVQQTVLADMDANDTARVVFQQVGGSQQTDLQGAGGYSYFCGHLVC